MLKKFLLFVLLGVAQTPSLLSIAFFNLLPPKPDGTKSTMLICADGIPNYGCITNNSFITIRSPFSKAVVGRLQLGGIGAGDLLKVQVIKPLSEAMKSSARPEAEIDETYSGMGKLLTKLDADGLYFIIPGKVDERGKRELLIPYFRQFEINALLEMHSGKKIVINIFKDGTVLPIPCDVTAADGRARIVIVSPYNPDVYLTLQELDEAAAHKFCPICQEKAELRCTGCSLQRYCGREHQRDDWKVHKPECTARQTQKKRAAENAPGHGSVGTAASAAPGIACAGAGGKAAAGADAETDQG